MDLRNYMHDYKNKVDTIGLAFLNQQGLAKRLQDSMIYSFAAGGKRLRPLLLFATLELFGVDKEKGLKTACAVEFIHTSSLIHDDLPCMDDDDFRRGKPSNHRMFDEATAILAGDALLLNSFELISTDETLVDNQKVKLISLLSKFSGAYGMVGGQQLDIENEGKQITLDELRLINAYKTGKLIAFPILAGGIIANRSEKELSILEQSAKAIGLAFQIQDDILDVIGNEETLGKKVHSDEKNHKSTYVTLLGLEEAHRQVEGCFKEACLLLDQLEGDGTLLKGLYQLIIQRNH